MRRGEVWREAAGHAASAGEPGRWVAVVVVVAAVVAVAVAVAAVGFDGPSALGAAARGRGGQPLSCATGNTIIASRRPLASFATAHHARRQLCGFCYFPGAFKCRSSPECAHLKQESPVSFFSVFSYFLISFLPI